MAPLPPIPPLEGLPDWQAYAAAGAAVVGGIVLLLWGRQVHRVVLLLALGGVGFALGGPIGASLGAMPVVAGASGAAVLAVVGILGARLIWAALAAAICAGSAVLVLLFNVLPKPQTENFPRFGEAQSLPQWVTESFKYVQGIFQAQWSAQPATLGLAVVVGCSLPFVVLLLRPRLGAILMTSLLGAAAIVGAVILTAGKTSQQLYANAFVKWYVPAGACGCLLVLGLARQYYTALAKKKTADAGEKKTEGGDKASPGKE